MGQDQVPDELHPLSACLTVAYMLYASPVGIGKNVKFGNIVKGKEVVKYLIDTGSK